MCVWWCVMMCVCTCVWFLEKLASCFTHLSRGCSCQHGAQGTIAFLLLPAINYNSVNLCGCFPPTHPETATPPWGQLWGVNDSWTAPLGACGLCVSESTVHSQERSQAGEFREKWKTHTGLQHADVIYFKLDHLVKKILILIKRALSLIKIFHCQKCAITLTKKNCIQVCQ